MQTWLIVALVLVIVCLIIFVGRKLRDYSKSPRAKRQRKMKIAAQIDDPQKRDSFMKETSGTKSRSLDADELFTRATVFLRMQDDLQDLLQGNRPLNARDRAHVARNLRQVSQLARTTIRDAIHARNAENAARDPAQEDDGRVFHDDIIQRRANEIEPGAAVIAPPIAAVPAPPAEPRWAPDPQNVHDSAVGDSINRRLRFLRENDLHAYDTATCIGAIAFIMHDRADQISADKRERIMQTLQRAQSNDHCERYDINELDALRLVMERALHTKSDAEKNNINDALLTSLADCTEGPADHPMTVCTIGRISRYVASLDAVDTGIPEMTKPVDAYRSEIIQKLGAETAAGKSAADRRAFLETECAKIAQLIPAHCLEKIKQECIAGIE